MANADGDKASRLMQNKRNTNSIKINSRKESDWKPGNKPKVSLQTKNKRQKDDDDDEEGDDDDYDKSIEDHYNSNDDNGDKDDDDDDEIFDDNDVDNDIDNIDDDDNDDESDDDDDDNENDDYEDDDELDRRIDIEDDEEEENEGFSYIGRIKQVSTGKLVVLDPYEMTLHRGTDVPQSHICMVEKWIPHWSLVAIACSHSRTLTKLNVLVLILT
ncbi:unnamed protein product [Parnassius mnemosyne]|uniref:Uncharacterized protein n=1 Tax=Parnassius mnemosyne TaxID=213953 RepID=A0AAV1LUD1_9NEOP